MAVPVGTFTAHRPLTVVTDFQAAQWPLTRCCTLTTRPVDAGCRTPLSFVAWPTTGAAGENAAVVRVRAMTVHVTVFDAIALYDL
ncbi:hypothetical protein GCM10025868_27640 [Angustibacter aerolatus]|uniref:Uncharacterized protein n=1 Tax=Angustibacter aerolatus TaxID=1162965 RepID=A0ABQ6JK67_9ACTN|nr:hypothetical protein GCM10025868_27640 [Angustibacter aerolatus]